ncbi:MAG: glycosyltransferase family 2 protein [Treponema sp.]|nr:glycosyltransferase family 2 protein [Treponema sp.]
MMKTGFVIPVYNHGATLGTVVSQLLVYRLPVIVVDDGNDADNHAEIAAVAAAHEEVVLVTRPKNGGKGKAVNDGVRKAAELGLTHVFQIDSDGQHDIFRVPFFLSESATHPDAVICGYPEYDESVPLSRKNGREISNRLARICTVSREPVDVLCGFRVYPVAPYIKIIDHSLIDGRMGYDIDILVHLSWSGVHIISRSVHVTYPESGISNFRIVRDNLHIAGTFSRLCAGMIVRLPLLLVRASIWRKQRD